MEVSKYDEVCKMLQLLLSVELNNVWYFDFVIDIDLGQKRVNDVINCLKNVCDLCVNFVLQLNFVNVYFQGGQLKVVEIILNCYIFSYKDDGNGWDLFVQVEVVLNNCDQELVVCVESYVLVG